MKIKMYSKILAGMLIIVVLLVGIVSGHSEEDFALAEEIIEQKTPCEDLTDNQLELLGDYYMEQMHPGEAHEYMDEMMGGEGSESLRQAHINMALSFYCGQHDSMSGGMMNMMMGRNMMAGYPVGSSYNTGINWFFNIALVLIIVLLIVLIYSQIQKK